MRAGPRAAQNGGKPPQGYDRAMKAAVIYENGGPDVLRYEDVPDPACPEGCVLIDVEAISIEGGDLLARAGLLRRPPRTSSATSAPARSSKLVPAWRARQSATKSWL